MRRHLLTSGLTTPDDHDAAPYTIRAIEHTGLRIQVACTSSLVHSVIEDGITAGWYEVEEARAAEALIGENDRVLELGGGLGAVAAYIWRTCHPHSYDVYEANPEIIPLLSKTLRLNHANGVRVHNQLLTARIGSLARGTAQLFVPPQFWYGSTSGRQADAHPIAVKAYSFSRCLRVLRPTVIICDIEGGEVDILHQPAWRDWLNRLLGGSFLPSVRSLVIEIHPEVTGWTQVARIRQRLEHAGFRSTSSPAKLLVMSRGPRT